MTNNESMLGRAYRKGYETLCGKHPRLRPWHFQWLDTFYLHRRLKQILPSISGRVLDVGCGCKPYRGWFGNVTEYVGLDLFPGPEVDIVVSPNSQWPLPESCFDFLLCTQVLEHVQDLHHSLNEIYRVLRNGGTAMLSFPFLYNEHAAPMDFHRFTAHAAERMFSQYDLLALERHGGIASTFAILFLNWCEFSLNLHFATRILKALLLPAWMLLCLVLNGLGFLGDRLDRTDAFYNNVLVVVKKRS